MVGYLETTHCELLCRGDGLGDAVDGQGRQEEASDMPSERLRLHCETEIEEDEDCN